MQQQMANLTKFCHQFDNRQGVSHFGEESDRFDEISPEVETPGNELKRNEMKVAI